MKKYIKIFYIYILPVFLIFFLFEYNLPKVKNSYNKKKNLFEGNISNWEILTLGSSLSLFGIDPVFFDYAGFNLANVSQSLYYDSQLFTNYLKEMKSLRIVLICIDYFSLKFNLSRCPEYWRTFYYERIYGIPIESKDHDLDIARFSLIFLYGRKESFKCALKLFKTDLAEAMKENGWMPYLNPKEELIENGKSRVAYHHQIMSEDNVSKNMGYLEKIIGISKANGIIPVIITMPVYRTYSDNIDLEEYQLTQRRINWLCKKYGIEYYNYFTDNRFKIYDFYDSDHLNSNGVQKISLIINEEVLKKLARYKSN